MLAHDLIVWTQALALEGELANAEPKQLLSRLLHLAARLAFSGRQAKLHLPAASPWTRRSKPRLRSSTRCPPRPAEPPPPRRRPSPSRPPPGPHRPRSPLPRKASEIMSNTPPGASAATRRRYQPTPTTPPTATHPEHRELAHTPALL
jgi:hypothetical protein